LVKVKVSTILEILIPKSFNVLNLVKLLEQTAKKSMYESRKRRTTEQGLMECSLLVADLENSA